VSYERIGSPRHQRSNCFAKRLSRSARLLRVRASAETTCFLGMAKIRIGFGDMLERETSTRLTDSKQNSFGKRNRSLSDRLIDASSHVSAALGDVSRRQRPRPKGSVHESAVTRKAAGAQHQDNKIATGLLTREQRTDELMRSIWSQNDPRHQKTHSILWRHPSPLTVIVSGEKCRSSRRCGG